MKKDEPLPSIPGRDSGISTPVTYHVVGELKHPGRRIRAWRSLDVEQQNLDEHDSNLAELGHGAIPAREQSVTRQVRHAQVDLHGEPLEFSKIGPPATWREQAIIKEDVRIDLAGKIIPAMSKLARTKRTRASRARRQFEN